MNNKKIFAMAMTAALATSAIVVVPEANAAPKKFKDVDAKAEYGQAIANLVERGVVKGYADGTFRPHQAITRGQSAKMLADMLALDTEDVVNPEYKDVAETNEYYGAIAALTEVDVFSGYADGSFRPNEAITREQLAKMLTTAYALMAPNGTTLPFKDVLVHTEAYDNVAALYHYGITKGQSPTEFGLRNSVTRAQFALFTTRTEQMLENRIQAKITADELNATIIEATYTEENHPETGEEIFALHEDGETIDIEAISEGKGMIIVSGSNVTEEEDYEVVTQKKYIVEVTKKADKLVVTLTESTEVTPTEISVEEEALGFEPKHIEIMSLDGKVLDPTMYMYEKNTFEVIEGEEIEEPETASYTLTMKAAGAYIATFSDDEGNSRRLGLAISESDFSFVAMNVIEKNEVLVSQDEIGFNVRDMYVEQFTAGLAKDKIVHTQLANDGVKITRAAEGNGLFSIRLTGNDDESIYVHGFMYELAGITTIEYMVVTSEEMDELQNLLQSLGGGDLGGLAGLEGLM